MPSQPSLRPFDVAVALRLILIPEDRYEPLANALATSTSACTARRVSSMRGSAAAGRARSTRRRCMNFSHGLRYSFPPVHGPERAGLPTAGAHPAIVAALGENAGPQLVWPMEGGPSRAESLTPLFSGMTRVVQRDGRMHEMLATVDLLRVGTPEQRAAAGTLLTRQLAID